MENASYIALSRQMALRRQLDVVANNLANMNTAGYRSQQMQFQTYLADRGSVTGAGDQPMSMVIDRAVMTDLRPGPIVETENALDVALLGDGYLRVGTPGGPRYTRNGHLSLDEDGRLVNAGGLPVLDPAGNPIEVPRDAERVSISEDGTVSAGDVQVGTIGLVEFAEPHRLEPLGGGLFVTNETPTPTERTSLLQGAIESSNVQPIVEMTQMIQIARSYESTQRMLQNEHERQRTAIRRLGQMSAS